MNIAHLHIGHEPPVPAVIRKRRGPFQTFLIQYATQCGFCARGILKIAACLTLLLEVCSAVASTPALHSQNGVLIEGCLQATQSARGCCWFPASGYRANDSGGLTNMSSNGNYWSFAPNSQTNARNLNFNSGNINPLNNNNRANGFSVRPSRALENADIPLCDVFTMQYEYKTIHRLVTEAYLKAREHERSTPAQLAFELNLERELAALSWELTSRTWTPGPLDWFVLTQPSIREVFAPQFRDRVVSHVLVLLIGPIFERHFIYDSHSCREGKGTLNGIARFEHHVKSVTQNFTKPGYCLNIDISGYFMSINRGILYEITWETLDKYRRRYPEAIDYDFVDYMISTFLWRDPLEGCVYHGNPQLQKLVMPGKSLRFQEPGVGLPIGDVRNQLNSNIYLNPFDQFVLRTLLLQGYDRYVDDGRGLHSDYNYLVECKERAGDFLSSKLHLTLHPNKTNITDLYDTNYFLGAAISPYRRYAMEGTLTRLRKYMDETEAEYDAGVPIDWPHFIASMNARLGYLQHFREVKSIDRVLARAPHVCSNVIFTPNYTKATLKQQ